MTPRERYLATLRHEKPDQVPIMVTCRPEVMDQLRAHYRIDDNYEVVRLLGGDMDRYASPPTEWRAFEKRTNGEHGGRRVIFHDERTFENEWGVVQRVGADGKYLEWAGGPLVDTDDLDSFEWPDESYVADDPALADRVRKFKEEGYWVVGSGGVHPFKQAWHMRGFENFLCDYMANPEWVEACYERILRFNLACCRKSAAAGVDMIQYWGDVAMQDRMIVPPEQWRALDKPAWKTIISETRKINPEVRFFFHCDGDIRPVIGDIIEVGFDILDPVQPECVNPGLIKKEWGDRVTLCGGGSVQRTLPFGTVEDVRQEVDFLMRTCAYDGGYVFRASNAVSFDCPIENVVAFFETARDYDLSQLAGPPESIPDPPCLRVLTPGNPGSDLKS